jgi:hypothetical protein
LLLTVFIVLCIVGLILWGINQIHNIPPIVKVVLYVIIGVAFLLTLLSFVQGGMGSLNFGHPNLH